MSHAKQPAVNYFLDLLGSALQKKSLSADKIKEPHAITALLAAFIFHSFVQDIAYSRNDRHQRALSEGEQSMSEAEKLEYKMCSARELMKEPHKHKFNYSGRNSSLPART